MRKFLIFTLLIACYFINYSQVNITGVVHDVNKKPISEVIIYEKGTTNTIKSDREGNFSIEISKLIDNKYLIEFSHQNYYITQVSGTKDEKVLDVEMVRHDENLNQKELNSKTVITGIIYNENDKKPISGVKVIEKNTNNTSTTDKDGKFSITINNLIDNKYTLLFKSKGYSDTMVTGFSNEVNLSFELSKLLDEKK